MVLEPCFWGPVGADIEEDTGAGQGSYLCRKKASWCDSPVGKDSSSLSRFCESCCEQEMDSTSQRLLQVELTVLARQQWVCRRCFS